MISEQDKNDNDKSEREKKTQNAFISAPELARAILSKLSDHNNVIISSFHEEQNFFIFGQFLT